MSSNSQVFIPQVSVYTRRETLQKIQEHTEWLAVNYFELLHSKYFMKAKREGIKQTFGVLTEKKIFLTSADHDERLWRFYQSGGVEKFKSDVPLLDADLVQGLDWFAYSDDPISKRRESIKFGMELTNKCMDMPNVIPTVQGTNFSEVTEFIHTFKKHGKNFFVLPVRGQLLNFGHRKKSQRALSRLIGTVSFETEVKLFVTGCNSPGLMRKLEGVYGFIGQGWLIQAKQRRMIMGHRYYPIMHSGFSPCVYECCAGLSKVDLCKAEFEGNRALHNLIHIQSELRDMKRSFCQIPLECVVSG